MSIPTSRSDLESLVEAARHWLDDDPDPETRAELRELIITDDTEGLQARFGSALTFGTAGLRGELGAGPNRMNRVVVQRAAAGLASYLRNKSVRGIVVIGYDARYNSEVFAIDTADVLAAAGFNPLVMPRALPTPVLAYAIRKLGAVAGVMVTASHNPSHDNGYKVYLGDGRQIVPPVDEEISARISAIRRVTDLPRDNSWHRLDETVIDGYVQRVASLVAPESPRALRVAYTPLHGVGRETLLAVFAAAGFAPPTVVPEQGDPDPGFPTVGFPNPEEPGVLDLALATAASSNSDLVIANDPDADRCAVAVRTSDGTYRMLTGDEVGTLLGAHLLQRAGTWRAGSFASTIVSSTMLRSLTEAHVMPFTETLTGFKWLARAPDVRYAYEEALGYCVDPDAVADKDGISAALLVCELAAGLAAEGRTLLDLLDDLAKEYGVHATSQVSVRVTELADRERMLQRLHDDPPHLLAGLTVEDVDDLTDTAATGLPPTPGLRFLLAERARVVVRPSGTEPKLKCYLEAVAPVPTGMDLADAKQEAADRLSALAADLAKAAGFPAP